MNIVVQSLKFSHLIRFSHKEHIGPILLIVAPALLAELYWTDARECRILIKINWNSKTPSAIGYK